MFNGCLLSSLCSWASVKLYQWKLNTFPKMFQIWSTCGQVFAVSIPPPIQLNRIFPPPPPLNRLLPPPPPPPPSQTHTAMGSPPTWKHKIGDIFWFNTKFSHLKFLEMYGKQFVELISIKGETGFVKRIKSWTHCYILAALWAGYDMIMSFFSH